MKRVFTVVVVTLLAGLFEPGSALHAARAASVRAGNVKVTLHYTGKGTVDASHKIWVWIFDSPQISAQSSPIDQMAVDKNDSDVVFEGVAPGQVWIAAAFDEQGAMSGDAPPPTGTPIGLLLGANGQPAAVTPGEKGIATLTFDDSIRMP